MTMKQLLLCRRGNVVVLAALSLVALLGFTAIGVDVGTWYARRQAMQSAADVAAIAGAHELSRGSSTALIEQAIYSSAQENGANPALVQYSFDANKVDVTITDRMTMFFSSIFLKVPPVVSVSAAAATKAVQICIMVLAKDGQGLYLQGAAELHAPGCNVQVDSTDQKALNLQGASSVLARSICVAGGAAGRGITPLPDEGCTGVPDPLSDFPEPAEAKGACSRSPIVSGTADPGVYCGGMNIIGDTRMNPGLYVIRGGNLVLGPSSLEGDGVTLYLQGSASIQMHGSARVKLRAPTSGPHAGVVIMSDRNPTALLSIPLGLPHMLTGNSSKSYEGAIYLPRGDVTFQGAAGSEAPSPFSIFIAHRVALVGAAKMIINNDYDATDVPLPGTMAKDRQARLVQ